jgi:hypothetical protein
MRFHRLALAAAFLAFAGSTHAATTTVSIIINSSTSTALACTPPTTLAAPLAAGTVICPLAITPTGWSGALALSGTNASSFALSGSNLIVGATALAAGSYSVTITATP